MCSYDTVTLVAVTGTTFALVAPSKTWTADVSWLPGNFVQIQGQMSNVIEFHSYAGKV